MSNSPEKKGIIELLSAMIIMGSVGLFVVESGQSSYNVVFYRCILGSIFLLVYCLYSGKLKDTGLTLKTVTIIIFSGVFLVFNWVMLFASFKTTSISTSTVIYHAQPFFFVLIWAATFRERVSLNKLLWMGLAFIGVALVADIDINEVAVSSKYILGIALALLAAIFWAASATLVKLLTGVSPYLITLIQLSVGIIVLLPFSDLSEISGVTMEQWSYLLVLGAVHTCLTYILMYSSYQKLSAPVIAVMTFIYPAVAIFVDFYFYDESMSAIQIVGVFMIMYSSYAVNQNLSFLSTRKINASIKAQGE